MRKFDLDQNNLATAATANLMSNVQTVGLGAQSDRGEVLDMYTDKQCKEEYYITNTLAFVVGTPLVRGCFARVWTSVLGKRKSVLGK